MNKWKKERKIYIAIVGVFIVLIIGLKFKEDAIRLQVNISSKIDNYEQELDKICNELEDGIKIKSKAYSEEYVTTSGGVTEEVRCTGGTDSCVQAGYHTTLIDVPLTTNIETEYFANIIFENNTDYKLFSLKAYEDEFDEDIYSMEQDMYGYEEASFTIDNNTTLLMNDSENRHLDVSESSYENAYIYLHESLYTEISVKDIDYMFEIAIVMDTEANVNDDFKEFNESKIFVTEEIKQINLNKSDIIDVFFFGINNKFTNYIAVNNSKFFNKIANKLFLQYL